MLTQAGHEGRVLIRGLRCCCNKQTARKFRKIVRNPARKEKDDWGETRGSTWYGWGWGFEIPLGELDQRDPRHLLVRLEGPNSLASSSPLAGLEKTSSPPTERKGRRRGVRRGVGSMGWEAGGGQPVRLFLDQKPLALIGEGDLMENSFPPYLPAISYQT